MIRFPRPQLATTRAEFVAGVLVQAAACTVVLALVLRGLELLHRWGWL